jgi:hypothetical protein
MKIPEVKFLLKNPKDINSTLILLVARLQNPVILTT